MSEESALVVVGGGLAGTEAAWQAAERGIHVKLYEMRPVVKTAAHVSDYLAELVCSNSLGGDRPATAPGLLKSELRRLGSLILSCADETAIPSGGALGVDRERFAARVTEHITQHPRIELRREEVRRVPDTPCIVASGPLTSTALTDDIARLAGHEHLYFYDAVAPIVAVDSIDMSVAFRGSRHDRDAGRLAGGDYINCPMTREDYEAFVDALLGAERMALHQFEQEDPHFFEGCLPVEILAARGRDALAYGPLRPVGLRDPRTGRRPYAVVQLRQDNLAGTLYNLVGFQTNLKWVEQKRVLRLVPGLANAEFLRYGMMHRNTFINSPLLLEPTMQFRARPDVLFAGQIVGVEGYVGNAATGWLAGVNAARVLQGQPAFTLPRETMIGSLCHYVTHVDPQDFQPMKANFGILPDLETPNRNKRERYQRYAQRALGSLEEFIGHDDSRSHNMLLSRTA